MYEHPPTYLRREFVTVYAPIWSHVITIRNMIFIQFGYWFVSLFVTFIITLMLVCKYSMWSNFSSNWELISHHCKMEPSHHLHKQITCFHKMISLDVRGGTDIVNEQVDSKHSLQEKDKHHNKWRVKIHGRSSKEIKIQNIMHFIEEKLRHQECSAINIFLFPILFELYG